MILTFTSVQSKSKEKSNKKNSSQTHAFLMRYHHQQSSHTSHLRPCHLGVQSDAHQAGTQSSKGNGPWTIYHLRDHPPLQPPSQDVSSLASQPGWWSQPPQCTASRQLMNFGAKKNISPTPYWEESIDSRHGMYTELELLLFVAKSTIENISCNWALHLVFVELFAPVLRKAISITLQSETVWPSGRLPVIRLDKGSGTETRSRALSPSRLSRFSCLACARSQTSGIFLRKL